MWAPVFFRSCDHFFLFYHLSLLVPLSFSCSNLLFAAFNRCLTWDSFRERPVRCIKYTLFILPAPWCLSLSLIQCSRHWGSALRELDSSCPAWCEWRLIDPSRLWSGALMHLHPAILSLHILFVPLDYHYTIRDPYNSPDTQWLSLPRFFFFFNPSYSSPFPPFFSHLSSHPLSLCPLGSLGYYL